MKSISQPDRDFNNSGDGIVFSYNATHDDIFHLNHIEIYQKDIILNRSLKTKSARRRKKIDNQIKSFTNKSRHNLIFYLKNTDIEFLTFVTLDYGESFPKDMNICRKDLNNFFRRLKKKYGKFEYLWRREFQERGAAHYHIFLSIKVDQEFVHRVWEKIIKSESKYLTCTKGIYNQETLSWYLMKSERYNTPSNIKNLGSFWGCSRGVKPKGEKLEINEDEFREMLKNKTGMEYPTDKQLYRVFYDVSPKLKGEGLPQLK